MDKEYYYIGKLEDGSIVIFSSRASYWESGYFANYNQNIIKFSNKGIKEYSESSRNGFRKEHPNIVFKDLTKEEFDNLKIFFKRLKDIVKGFLELKEDTQKTSARSYFRITDDFIELIKKLPGDIYEYIVFEKKPCNRLHIASLESKCIHKENYNPLPEEVYDFLKYIIETTLEDRYNLLSALLEDK